MNFFARQGVAFRNDLNRSAGALLGIVQGLIADSTLNDAEIKFLRTWLHNNQNIAAAWLLCRQRHHRRSGPQARAPGDLD